MRALSIAKQCFEAMLLEMFISRQGSRYTLILHDHK
jgi:hypothetical protein